MLFEEKIQNNLYSRVSLESLWIYHNISLMFQSSHAKSVFNYTSMDHQVVYSSLYSTGTTPSHYIGWTIVYPSGPKWTLI